jgi:leucyl-tRNA synthetase
MTNRNPEILLNQTIKKVTEDIDGFKFNTAISTLMIFVNALEKEDRISRSIYQTFLILLSPFAPHIAEELWHGMGYTESIFLASWPVADPKFLVDEEVTIVISVNGKVRANIVVLSGSDEESVKALALAHDRVKPFLEGKEIRKTVFVPDKIMNIVIG